MYCSYGSYKIPTAPTRLLQGAYNGSFMCSGTARIHHVCCCRCSQTLILPPMRHVSRQQALHLFLNLCSRVFVRMAVAGFIRRRITGKRANPYGNSDIPPLQSTMHSAVLAEAAAADGLVPLPWDTRRRHVHWTHCRTNSPDDVQPCDLTREEFWNHLVRLPQRDIPSSRH